MILTTVASSIGFFALTTSDFVPIRHFGLLSGAAMIVALAADLWFVPAMLTLLGPATVFGKKRGPRRGLEIGGRAVQSSNSGSD